MFLIVFSTIASCKATSNSFFQPLLYESLAALCFKRDVHKKVYMLGMRLVFVLLEKLADPFSNWTNPNIGGIVRVRKDTFSPDQKSQSSLFYVKFMGELKT